MSIGSEEAGRGKLRRIVTLYVLPIVSLGIIAWVETTKPPAPILVGFIALLGWPALAAARSQGELDGLAWAKRRVDATTAGRAALSAGEE